MHPRYVMLANGLLTSTLATLLVRAIAEGRVVAGTLLDFAVLASAAVGYQLWKTWDFPLSLLLWEALGSSLGTFLVLVGAS